MNDQLPASFVPDAPAGLPSSFVPDAAPDFTTQNAPIEPSLWAKANTPLVPQIADAAHAIADHLDAPKLDRGKTEAQIRGFLSGATTGAGDVAAGFTSPIGIALMLTGMSGESGIAKAVPGLKALLDLPAVRVAQRAVQGAAGTGFAAHGAARVVTDPTLTGKAQGVLEAATGALGAVTALPSPRGALANPNAADAAAVKFGQDRGVPVDLGTASGNKAVQGVQFLADRSLAGSVIGQKAQQATGAALERVGGDLADVSRGTSVTPEQAGQGIRDALASKMQAHHDLANHAYDRLRELEAQPTNRMAMPTGQKAPVDAVQAPIVAQLRRIVHEMDASGYSPGKLVDTAPGVSSGSTYSRGSGGAKVFDDITQHLGSTPTRGNVQSELERYLGGGKETAAVKAALHVATDRMMGRNQAISTPELPVSAMSVPTRLEGARTTSEDMGLPVDLTSVKTALKPVHDQLMRQLPVTQQQANPGLKAIGNILEGPDYASLSQTDRDLSAIKTLAREHGGIAKIAVAKLDAAVKQAALNGGPDVLTTLNQGRAATTAKYVTQGLIDKLPGGKMEEPVAVFKQATAPKDSGIEFLRAVADHAPQTVPQIARAKLEELMSMAPDKQFAEWRKLGSETKGVLFPQAGQAQALDHFFLLSKRLAFNPNPSGTANQVSLAGQAMTLANPSTFWPSLMAQMGAGSLSALLHNPTTTQALTRAMVVSQAGNTAARAAALASLSRAAQRVGVTIPQAATNPPPATDKPVGGSP